jgi:hypothetical protein
MYTSAVRLAENIVHTVEQRSGPPDSWILPLFPGLYSVSVIEYPRLEILSLPITLDYSQRYDEKVPIGAGVPLAYNGDQPVYRYKNQKGIAPAHQNTLPF